MSASYDDLGNSCDNSQETSDTHNSAGSQDNATTSGAIRGNDHTCVAKLRGDDDSGFATSDFPPLPTHSNYPVFEEVRQLKEALQTENRKVAALEEELAAVKRWLSQAPAEIVALVSGKAADGTVSDAGGSAESGGASHERFRQRTGNPRSSFFNNSRVDLSYNYRTNPSQDTGGNGRDGSATGGEHSGGGFSRRGGRGRRSRGMGGGRDRGSGGTRRARYEISIGDYGNPFPGPNTAAGGNWDSQSNPQATGDWGSMAP